MFHVLLLTLVMSSPQPAELETSLTDLQKVYDAILQEDRVDYQKLKDQKKLQKVLANYARLMAENDFSQAPKDTRIALYSNAYNVFTLIGVLKAWPVKSVTEIAPDYGFFSQNNWNVNGKRISLNTLEKTYLRDLDPRIHFIINCASASCPPLLAQVLRPEHIQKQMEQATLNFLKDPSKNKITKRSWQLSKIFEWYAADWGGTKETLAFIQKTLKQKRVPKNISYLEYDWALNGM